MVTDLFVSLLSLFISAFCLYYAYFLSFYDLITGLPLKWFVSHRENLATDKYLVSQMDGDQFVPIWTVANFNAVRSCAEISPQS